MTIDEIRAAYRAEPFRPFVLRFTDGTEVPIPNRFHMGFPPDGQTVGVGFPDGTVDVVEINRIADLVPAGATTVGH